MNRPRKQFQLYRLLADGFVEVLPLRRKSKFNKAWSQAVSFDMYISLRNPWVHRCTACFYESSQYKSHLPCGEGADGMVACKDREHVDYLFCSRNTQLAQGFLNRSLIPALCAKAGVVIEDAKGRITGHWGRSTHLIPTGPMAHTAFLRH